VHPPLPHIYMDHKGNLFKFQLFVLTVIKSLCSHLGLVGRTFLLGRFYQIEKIDQEIPCPCVENPW
jgi:hypothetical protein